MTHLMALRMDQFAFARFVDLDVVHCVVTFVDVASLVQMTRSNHFDAMIMVMETRKIAVTCAMMMMMAASIIITSIDVMMVASISVVMVASVDVMMVAGISVVMVVAGIVAAARNMAAT